MIRPMSKLSGFAVAAFFAVACMPPPGGLDEASLADWLEGYEAAWEDKDAAQAAALFTEAALYQQTPYEEPFRGQTAIGDYWAGVTADQSDIDFQYEILAVEDEVGIAQWSATFRSISGDVPVELNGIFVLEFDDEMRCTSLREWWHAR